jgi:hypothetical protein
MEKPALKGYPEKNLTPHVSGGNPIPGARFPGEFPAASKIFSKIFAFFGHLCKNYGNKPVEAIFTQGSAAPPSRVKELNRPGTPVGVARLPRAGGFLGSGPPRITGFEMKNPAAGGKYFMNKSAGIKKSAAPKGAVKHSAASGSSKTAKKSAAAKTAVSAPGSAKPVKSASKPAASGTGAKKTAAKGPLPAKRKKPAPKPEKPVCAVPPNPPVRRKPLINFPK